jgi:hypothetical protein
VIRWLRQRIAYWLLGWPWPKKSPKRKSYVDPEVPGMEDWDEE